MKNKILCLLFTLIYIISFSGCTNDIDSIKNTDTMNPINTFNETLIGSFESDLGESWVSEMHIDSDEKIYINYSEDCGEDYNYNITDQARYSQDISQMAKASDTQLIGMSAKLSLRGTKVIITDSTTNEVINEIPTNLNSESTPYDIYFRWSSNISLDFYGEYIYMINENGVFRAKCNDREFQCLINSDDVKYLKIENYKSFLKEIYPMDQVMSYRIFVVSENKIIVTTNFIDDDGYGYILYYIEYDFS